MSVDLEELYDKIYRYCYMKLGHRQTAEDVTQETFLRFLAASGYRDIGKETAYLYTIARNLCVDACRRKKLQPLPEDWQEAALTENKEEGLLTALTLQQAVERLTKEDRELVFLRYVNGLSAAEIGEILDLSRFAVHRRLKACLKQLKEILGKEGFL